MKDINEKGNAVKRIKMEKEFFATRIFGFIQILI
jgi:hypothetical protein